jgi:hypothetical protein
MRLSHYGRWQGNKTGSSGEWAGAFDVSDEREKSFGGPDLFGHLSIKRMKQKILVVVFSFW